MSLKKNSYYSSISGIDVVKDFSAETCPNRWLKITNIYAPPIALINQVMIQPIQRIQPNKPVAIIMIMLTPIAPTMEINQAVRY